MGIKQILEDFQDHSAPRLDTYEQAIYLYLFRHTRLKGESNAVIGLKGTQGFSALSVDRRIVSRVRCGLRSELENWFARVAHRRVCMECNAYGSRAAKRLGRAYGRRRSPSIPDRRSRNLWLVSDSWYSARRIRSSESDN